MLKSLPVKHLPLFLTRLSLPAKLLLGVLFILFVMGYEPVFGFPPIRQSVARAQNEQLQIIDAQALPFTFQNPHGGYISTKFSLFHPGIDIATNLGTQIHPVAGGTVIDTGYNFWGLGLVVMVDHGDGYQSLYAHMGKIYVQKGQKVSQGDVLGEVGLTGNTSGPHTHLQISKNGQNIDPQTLLPTLSDHPQG